MDIGRQTRVIRVEPLELELPVDREAARAAGSDQPNDTGAEPAASPARPARAHRRSPRRRESHEPSD